MNDGLASTGIVVTGIGIIGSLGIGRETFWKNFLSGQSGIKPIQEFHPLETKIHFGGEVEGFRPKEYLSPLIYRKMGRSSRLAVVASLEALQDARLEINDLNRDRIGVFAGTGYGNSGLTDEYFVSFMEGGPQGANPLLFADTVPNTAGSHISLFHRLRGPITTFCQNLISAELALIYACRQLQAGSAEAILVVGVDELSPIVMHAFSVLKGLNPSLNPILGGGLVLGEGACVLVLERREQALFRRASIYGEITAFTLNSGVTRAGHFEPEGRAMKKVVQECLKTGGAQGRVPDLISLSANFSGELDRLEIRILREVFGDDWSGIALSPLKYFAGEYGGMGALRLAILLLAFRDQMIPPTVNPDQLEPGTPWDRRYLPARPGKINQGLLTGFTFGGGNACLAVQRV
jgi:3-oxoacyl-[acyl-carrier-protein] synthase II